MNNLPVFRADKKHLKIIKNVYDIIFTGQSPQVFKSSLNTV